MGKLGLSVDPLDKLLVMLGLCNERAIESPEELASLFEEIGQALKDKGQERLAAEAYAMSVDINPSGVFQALRASKRPLAIGENKIGTDKMVSSLNPAP